MRGTVLNWAETEMFLTTPTHEWPRLIGMQAWRTIQGTQMSTQYATSVCYDDLGQSSCQKPQSDIKAPNLSRTKWTTMREFFNGWRRTWGVGTLLAALFCVGAWCRSQHQVDVVTLDFGANREIFASTEGRIVWDHRNIDVFGRRGTAKYSVTLRLDVSEKLDKPRFRYLDDWSITWRRRGWGFDFGEARNLAGIHVIFRAVPYWSIMLVMTLASAYLLVRKPRKGGVTAIEQREPVGTSRPCAPPVSPTVFN